MNQRQAFMQAIIEAPDDDTPRLVFADWLDDEGDAARAEFIRTQIALERLPAGDARRPELARREKDLLQTHGWDWAEEVVNKDVAEWRYRRGFIEHIVTSFQHASCGIGGWMAKAPIRHVRDNGLMFGLEGVAEALPQLERLAGLELWGIYEFEDEDLAALLSSPHLANLQTLIIHHSGPVGDDGTIVEALHSPHRRNLRELGVNLGDSHGPSVPILMAMAVSEYLRNLRILHVPAVGSRGDEPGLSPVVMCALVESHNLAGLQELNLAGTSAHEDAWDVLLSSPLLGRLKRLWLGDASVPHRSGSYFDAFRRPGLSVDLEASFGNPQEAGRWSGQTWVGRQAKHLAEMAPYLKARDADGLERAFRAKCALLAGEGAARTVDELDIRGYERLLRPIIEEAISTAQEGGAILLDFMCGSHGTASAFRLNSPLRDGPFPRERATSLPLSHQPGPSIPFPEMFAVWDGLRPAGVEPRGGRLYLHARAAAAFLRCLGDSPVTAYYETFDPGLLFRL